METIPEILAHCVRSFGDRVALRAHGGAAGSSYTFRQIDWKAAELAERLTALGAARAAPVALMCENRPEWPLAYFAIHLTGAVCVPIDAALSGGEIRTILSRSRARLLVVSRALASAAREGVAGLANVTLKRL